jgi:hypothetical protein
LARLDESIADFNQRFIFPLPFAIKRIKINLWNQGTFEVDGSIIELLRVGHFERAYPNKDWGAHKIKTSVLTFVYIFYTCAEGTVI